MGGTWRCDKTDVAEQMMREGWLRGAFTVEKYGQKRPFWPILDEFLDSQRMGGVIDRDQSLNALHELPEGCEASRVQFGEPWSARRSG